VIDLGAGGPDSLEARVAAALGDPRVHLGYRLSREEGFIGWDGRPLDTDGRQLTWIGDDGLAVLLHDRGAGSDPALLSSVSAAAAVAVANARLQADVRELLAQLAASRRRIVEAGDRQRRRFERELRVGAIAKLAAVRRTLAACEVEEDAGDFARALADTLAEVLGAEAELDEFARGVRPPLLAGGGLAAALTDLAARAPVPVELHAVAGRFAPATEGVAYFVCAESLANLAKHARASHARLLVERRQESLVVAVADDGVGGADVTGGSGLVGLRDRVEALGGRLEVESPHGGGTRVEAVVPIG
jgi:signal transduction histidine kinase